MNVHEAYPTELFGGHMAGATKERKRLTQDDVAQLPALIDMTTTMALLGVSRRYACVLAREGKFIATKVGRDWRVNTRSLLAYAGLDQ